jgi:predicted short-subunit dehydrogenase-like oxidoreductase (DUF2520 family)
MRELEREAIPLSPAPAPPTSEGRIDALRIAIVGAGRAGGSIAAAARAAGLATELAGRGEVEGLSARADVVLLCVPDSATADVASRVAAVDPRARFVGHESGAVGLEALGAPRRMGAETFILHPLQTLPNASSELSGAACAVTGSSPEASRFAETLAERLGMRPFELADEHRAAYHAAACVASNFLVALEESAVELLEVTGVEQARELLVPLVLRTAVNWSELGAASLTGPIARGDEETIERHIEALGASAPRLLPLYRALAERTRTIAEERAAER